MLKRIFIFLLFPVLCYSQKDLGVQVKNTQPPAATGQRPDVANMKYEDIKFAKADEKTFWFYYKPTQYFFKNNEFETITLENKDILVYIHELQRYVLLEGFGEAEKEKEHDVSPVANSNCVFIRSDLRGYWIYDKGFKVPNLSVLSINNLNRQYMLRSSYNDKRYIIDEVDFRFGKLNTPVGIIAE